MCPSAFPPAEPDCQASAHRDYPNHQWWLSKDEAKEYRESRDKQTGQKWMVCGPTRPPRRRVLFQ
jgi:hypothetical protein